MTNAFNYFVYSQGGKKLELLAHDILDWNITFADTGLHANIGQRLQAVRKYVADDEMFLAHDTDCLADLPLPEMIQYVKERNKIAAFVSVKPNATFHLVEVDGMGLVTDIRDVTESNQRINGGFFVLRREIFDYVQDGEELVQEPFRRLIAAKQLIGYAHRGFWACMDTVKELQQLEELHSEEKHRGRYGTSISGWHCRPGFMMSLGFKGLNSVLCLGAHADDIEIGCGGTILRLVQEQPKLKILWVVFGAEGRRRREARASARAFLGRLRLVRCWSRDLRMVSSRSGVKPSRNCSNG